MKPIQHAACLCALSALLALSPAVALCENTPAENQQAEDDRLQTGKQANLRKLPNKKSDKLETLNPTMEIRGVNSIVFTRGD